MLRTTAALAILLAVSSVAAAHDVYELGPDSKRQEGVPEGKVTKHTFTRSEPSLERSVIIGCMCPRSTKRTNRPA